MKLIHGFQSSVDIKIKPISYQANTDRNKLLVKPEIHREMKQQYTECVGPAAIQKQLMYIQPLCNLNMFVYTVIMLYRVTNEYTVTTPIQYIVSLYNGKRFYQTAGLTADLIPLYYHFLKR